MTDHRAKAARLLVLAESTYLDDSNNAMGRDEYETEQAWLADVEFEAEMHQRSVAEATLLAQMATAHALLARLADPSGTEAAR